MKTPNATHPTGLDDAEFRLVSDRGLADLLLYLEFFDGEYVGEVSGPGGDPVACVTLETARLVVSEHNADVLERAEARRPVMT